MRLVTLCLLLCLALEGGSKEPRRRRKEQNLSPASPAQGSHGCQFPDDMRGSWFLGGSRKDFVIKKKQFGLGAWCYRLQDEQRCVSAMSNLHSNDTSLDVLITVIINVINNNECLSGYLIRHVYMYVDFRMSFWSKVIRLDA